MYVLSVLPLSHHWNILHFFHSYHGYILMYVLCTAYGYVLFDFPVENI